MKQYEYIAHHGIKGQKWGVRRYQNPDGTLTDAGKKKYSKKASRLTRSGDIHKGRSAYYNQLKGPMSVLGGLATGVGAHAFISTAVAASSIPYVGIVSAPFIVGGAVGYGVNKTLYSAAAALEKEIAKKKYSEAAEYRKRLGA